jgi:hypothetical protein
LDHGRTLRANADAASRLLLPRMSLAKN